MSLFFQGFGPKQAESILFLHGGGMSGWMWEDQVEVFKKEYHCIVPDLPGHGRNIASSPFSITESAKEIATVIQNHTSEKKAHIVGLSLGAQVALQLIATSPELVDRALINSALVRPFAINKMTTLMLKMTLPLARSRSFARIQAKSLGIPERHFEAYFKDSREISPDTFIEVMKENASFGLPSGLKEAKTMALILVGEKEKKIMHRSAQDVVNTMPHGQGYVIEEVGHAFNLEDPERFNRILHAWLQNHPLPPEEGKEITPS